MNFNTSCTGGNRNECSTTYLLSGSKSVDNVITSHMLTTVANQPGFSGRRPRTWNDLPDDVTSAESLSTFRQRLKTHLFTKSFS